MLGAVVDAEQHPAHPSSFSVRRVNLHEDRKQRLFVMIVEHELVMLMTLPRRSGSR